MTAFFWYPSISKFEKEIFKIGPGSFEWSNILYCTFLSSKQLYHNLFKTRPLYWSLTFIFIRRHTSQANKSKIFNEFTDRTEFTNSWIKWPFWRNLGVLQIVESDCHKSLKSWYCDDKAPYIGWRWFSNRSTNGWQVIWYLQMKIKFKTKILQQLFIYNVTIHHINPNTQKSYKTRSTLCCTIALPYLSPRKGSLV